MYDIHTTTYVRMYKFIKWFVDIYTHKKQQTLLLHSTLSVQYQLYSMCIPVHWNI